jgi:sporulation protein YlmC with PRC-barrel domain
MLRNVNSLIGNLMEATDGEMGKVEDFYFDDQAWIVVYLIVKTGNWLSGRKVLISPYVLINGTDLPGTFPVNLTKQQIKDSPDIDTDLPVSRQHEIALHQYYPWQSYWGTGFYEGGIWGIVTPPPVDGSLPVKAAGGDLHLRSTHAISGYHIETTDGELGHLIDFVIDDETWHIEYLVIEMHSWLTGKKVLIARKHIKEIRWATSKILVDVTRFTLEKRPPFDESTLFRLETQDTVFDNNLHLR